MTELAGRPAAPWRDERFRIFAAGNFVNNVGEAAYKVGLPLFVYELTGSAASTSPRGPAPARSAVCRSSSRPS